MARRQETILLKGIHIEADRLPLVESHVIRLMASIKEVGLLEPIVVCRRTKRSPAVVLVAGRHRYEACKRLKHKEIAASVENEESDAVEQWRALAEIDENLIRRDLSTAQRAKLTARRKVAYELINPETKQGKGAGKPKEKSSRTRSFAKDTAEKTGKSRQTIERDAAIGLQLGDDLDRIAGTRLDTQKELIALAKMPEPARNDIITRAASGEEVSAIKVANEQVGLPVGLVKMRKTWAAFEAAWKRGDPDACEALLNEIHDDANEIFGGPRNRKAA